MEKHSWDKEKYSVKIDLIDEQHQYLFEIINELDDVIEKRSSSLKIRKLLKKLEEYTLFHFTTEEHLLSTHNYPGLYEHKEKHASFIEKIARFNEDFRYKNKDISVQLSDYLFNWLFSHIAHDDKDYSQFLTAKGIK